MLYSARRCGLDGGLLTVWMGVLVAELGVLSGRRERRLAFLERRILPRLYRRALQLERGLWYSYPVTTAYRPKRE